jgi:RNA polymerase sigma factor (sigma-70 family)
MSPKEFENIVPALRPLMVKVGRDFFGNRTDADDVAQEGLIRLWKYCERLSADRNMEALAIKVAKNVCVEIYKRRSTLTVTLESETEINQALADNDADAGIEAGETQQKIDEAMERLSARERELLRKRHIEGYTADEIAQETGIPKPSVKSMISIARKKMIKELQKILQA